MKFSLKTTQLNVLAQSHSPPQAICDHSGPEPNHRWHMAPSPTIGTICAPAVGGQGLFLLPVSYSPKLNQRDLKPQELTGSDTVSGCRWEPMQQSFPIYYLGKSKAAFKIWLMCSRAGARVLEGDRSPFRRHRQQRPFWWNRKAKMLIWWILPLWLWSKRLAKYFPCQEAVKQASF